MTNIGDSRTDEQKVTSKQEAERQVQRLRKRRKISFVYITHRMQVTAAKNRPKCPAQMKKSACKTAAETTGWKTG